MRDVRVNVFCNLIVAVLFLAPFSHAVENQARRCDVTKAEEQCGHNERCVQQLVNEEARCECQRDYVLVDGQCLHRKTAMFVTTTAQPESGVVGVLLYLGARRYKWLQRFRLFRPNRHGDILITRDDDDDDDPPIG
ncbi:uncharacterized protein LOC116433842 isoform X2 [Nomia melanderi]|uniref:uncharacterized protein LOC116433842 isoform X2 n=1 Tax=Nomia melanderi TaxID=2448451 RepID=UPI00130436F8|nr:uncharacterized protein LOC116433842 isoform X2 [Nomia melanderi]